MSEVLGFIPDDGYTEEAVLNAAPGLYPRVCFSYRPMLSEEKADYFKAANKLAGMQLRRLACGYLASHIKKWDLKDAKDAVAKIDAALLTRVKDPLFDRIFAVVFADAAPDSRPESSEAEKEAELADALKAAETGQTVAQVREERERKN